MKTLRLLLAIFTLGLAFASCQKDFSFEAGNSKGTLLKTTAGDCDGINVQGIYFKDTLLKSSNYVDVQVDFTKIGTYTIKSDTVNGYSFSGVGNITALGVNTVRLVAVGKPIVDGFDAFTLNYNGSTCLFNVQVILGTGGGTAAAVYAFGLTGMACTGATLAGTYTAGVAMTPANTVTIPITVTTPGTYNITTAVNGVTFSGTGNLALTTPSVVLTATGITPTSIMPLPANFPVNSGTTTCGFDVTFAATPSAAVFTFNCGGTSINGTYQVGVNSASVNNYIDYPITVTTAGLITANTPTVDGFSFSGSSIVTTATTSIRLFATGTPTLGTTPFATFPTPCNIAVPVAPAAASGVLKFDNLGVTKNFNFNQDADTTATPVIAPLPAGFYLDIFGETVASPPTESLTISVFKPTTYFAAMDMFTVNQFASFVILDITFTDATGTDFEITTDAIPQLPGFRVDISSVTPTRIIGTFSGTLKNAGGTPYVITNGMFDLPLP